MAGLTVLGREDQTVRAELDDQVVAQRHGDLHSVTVLEIAS